MSATPRTDAIEALESRGYDPVSIADDYRTLARTLERENEELRAALEPFANLDRSVNSDLWVIRPEYCNKARAALAREQS